MGIFIESGRGEKSLKKLLDTIKKDAIPVQTSNDEPTHIKCKDCDGTYTLRLGKYSMFAGCSNYPKCKSTLKLTDYILEYIKKYGLNIYRWERVCYQCKKKTYVYSYYLNYELEKFHSFFNILDNVGLGDLSCVDNILSKEIDTIQMKYSNTTKSSYMANTCQHCGALQGKNFVVYNPTEIINELYKEHSMEKFLFATMNFDDVTPLKEYIEFYYGGLNDFRVKK